MRVAVMAAGAVGGYFGGRMAAAGHDVFIARGAHGGAVRRAGLKIESALGDLHLKNVNVTDDPKQVGPVDVVLFAVKLWDTETAAEQTRALVGPNTRVITLQNGVDSVERLAPILGDEATCWNDLRRHGHRKAWCDPPHRHRGQNPLRPSRRSSRCRILLHIWAHGKVPATYCCCPTAVHTSREGASASATPARLSLSSIATVFAERPAWVSRLPLN
jgi:Ketopantoate reductase PanE/ApbA